MEKGKLQEIIKQVLYNPQVSFPPISYRITDFGGEEEYTSAYMDVKDFNRYRERLEAQLISRLASPII